MHSQQEIEKYYFEKFLDAINAEDKNFICADKPDIIYKENTGVEITNLYIKNGEDFTSEQRQTKLRDIVIKNAQEYYEEKCQTRVSVLIGFNPEHPLPLKNHHQISQAIAELIIKNNTVIEKLSSKKFKHIKELRFIYIQPQEFSEYKWDNIQSYTVPFIDETLVLKNITNKEIKIKDYRTQHPQVNQYWLLLIIDYINFAQDQHVPETFHLKNSFKSNYDKIFLFKTGYNQVVNLYTKPPSSDTP